MFLCVPKWAQGTVHGVVRIEAYTLYRLVDSSECFLNAAAIYGHMVWSLEFFEFLVFEFSGFKWKFQRTPTSKVVNRKTLFNLFGELCLNVSRG